MFVDVETTGLDSSDRIVSFAGIALTTAGLAEGKINLQFGHYLVDPGRKSHPRAEAVHGYSDWLLRHQDPFTEIAETVANLIAETDLIVAHNAEFDVGFINAELTAHSLPAIAKPIFCTMERFRGLNPGVSARLDVVAARMGLSREGTRHSALEDAWLAMMVYLRLHDCPYRMPFGAFPNPQPSNLRPAPQMPEGPLPRRKRVRRLVTREPGPKTTSARPAPRQRVPAEDRLQRALTTMPLPAAFEEAAIALRQIILEKKRAGEPWLGELNRLYGLAQIHGFLYESFYDPGLGFSVHVIAELIPPADLEITQMPYGEIGYRFLPLLKKSDVRGLIEIYGEPASHASMRERLRDRWETYRSMARTRLIC